MPTYALIAGYTFRRFSTYRGAMVGGMVANTAFGFIQVAILIAVWNQNPGGIGGYDTTDATTYVFLVQAMIGPISIFAGGSDLAERIRTGDVATDLFRPVDFQMYWLSQDVGRAAYAVIGRSALPFAVGALAFHLRVPSDPRVWAAFAMSAFLGLLASFAARYLVALSSFWLLDERGVAALATTVTTLFSGMLLPLVLFPSWLGGLARALPWSSMIQVPVDVFLQQRSGRQLLSAYAFQLGWAVALLAVGRVVTRAARHKVVAQGG